MGNANEQNSGKRIPPGRFYFLVLLLTLVVFGVIGALVTLLPQTAGLHAPNMKKETPPVHRIDLKSLQK